MTWIHSRFESSCIVTLLALSFAGMPACFAGDGPAAEWTLEQARICWQPMTRAVQHVGVPGYQFQTGVMWDGAIVFGPLAARDLKVMQQELAPLGNTNLHLSFGYGEPMRLVDRQGTHSPLIRRSLAGGRHPIPSVETRDGDLTWQETVFAHLLDRTADQWMQAQVDDTLVTHVIFTVRNVGPARRIGHLWMHFGDTSQVHFGYKCGQSPELGNGNEPPAIGQEISFTFEQPFGRVAGGVRFVIPQPSSGDLVVHEEVNEVRGIAGTPKNVLEWKVPLGPGEDAELRLLIPYGVVSQEVADKIAGLDSRNQHAEVLGFWKQLQYGPGQIITPDPFFNDYLVAVTGQMAQQVAYRARSTKTWLYKTSPNHYENYWPCNAAKALPTFDFRGLTELNRRVLQGFIDARTEDIGGLNRAGMGHGDVLAGEGFAPLPGFMGNFDEWTANPLLISHGLGLWALATHYRIARDQDWLGEGPASPLQAMLEGFDWIAQQRKRTMREIDGKKVPYWGLLPAASAHDWLAGNTVFNDAFCIYGMTEVVRLMREIHHPRAEEMASELNAYRQCLRDRYWEATQSARPLPLSDGTMLPFVPRMVQELDWAKPDWTYTGYSAMRAGAWGVFDPHDKLTDLALAYLEAGMPKGEGAYFNTSVYQDTANVNLADISDPHAERHYLWRHYVEYETMWPIGGPLFLARDDLPRYFEWLFHNMAFALHHDFRVGVESWDGVPSCAPGDGERWQIIRKMFVHEFGGYDGSEQSLWLLQALPRSWLKPGDRLSVKEMATTFGGMVDLSVRVADDGDSVIVDGELKGLAVKPKEIRVRLRSGDGRPLASATVNGHAVEVQSGDVILLPPMTDGAFAIVATF